ncbi:MAG: histidine kinase [Bacillota bacterium]|nr:histidine kinase [Bacillota bacterium]
MEHINPDLLQENLYEKKEFYKERLKTYFRKYPVFDARMSTAFRMYRYISLFLTSVLFLIGPFQAAPLFKVGVIGMLSALTILVLHGYKHYHKNVTFVSMLILLETLCIVMLLAITGGFESAFIWYALNPLIAAFAYLPVFFTWLFLGLFFLWSIAGEILLHESVTTVSQVIRGRSDIMLIMILLTLVIQTFSRLYFILKEQSQKLQLQQRQAEKTLEHISSLYEVVETITSRDDPREIIDLFAAYAKALTGCEKVIFWMENLRCKKTGEEHNFIYTVRGDRSFFPDDLWQANLLQAWSEIKEYRRVVIGDIKDYSRGVNGQLICVPVKSRSCCFGMLAALQSQKLPNLDEIMPTLSFLADLCAISIERNMSEQFTDKLIVIEEQNRIANEIHDSISQNLFSMVYGLDVIVRKVDYLAVEHREILTTIRDAASQTAKELRLLVHGLSPRHRGDDTFVQEVRTYLDGLASLNNVSIDFQITGKEEFLNPAMRRAFYRIIKEATGNAVRHGKCSEIKLDLEMSPFGSNLKIADNGKGFDVSLFKEIDENSKLGLVNMRELTFSLQGVFTIDSKIGEGTVITCSVPVSTGPQSCGSENMIRQEALR